MAFFLFFIFLYFDCVLMIFRATFVHTRHQHPHRRDTETRFPVRVMIFLFVDLPHAIVSSFEPLLPARLAFLEPMGQASLLDASHPTHCSSGDSLTSLRPPGVVGHASAPLSTSEAKPPKSSLLEILLLPRELRKPLLLAKERGDWAKMATASLARPTFACRGHQVTSL